MPNTPPPELLSHADHELGVSCKLVFPILVELVMALIFICVGFFILTALSVILGLLPAIVAALVVYLVTRSIILTGVAFVFVAILWAMVRRK